MKLWIARDKDGELYLYDKKPILDEDCFNSNSNGKYNTLLHLSYFPEVTFENSPQEVELKLVSEIVGVAESPLKTFPRVNEFEVGSSYRH